MEGSMGGELYRPDRDFAVKAAIFESLRNLVCGDDAKPLDKVTIDEICEGCGIARRTFYNHFPDKYAVVVWIREVGGAANFGQIGLSLTLRDAVRSLVHATAEYGDFLRECHKSKHYPEVESYIRKLARAGLKYAVAIRSGKPLSDEDYIRVRYLVVAIDVAVRDWVAGKLDVTADQLADALVGMFPQDLTDLLEQPADLTGSTWLDFRKTRIQPFGKDKAHE